MICVVSWGASFSVVIRLRTGRPGNFGSIPCWGGVSSLLQSMQMARTPAQPPTQWTPAAHASALKPICLQSRRKLNLSN
jgi:hypothetical protein